ncbi:glycoside hydrolase family 2 protein [Xylariaceae sp. FL1272]|nr:glycoside hydrolase family 2 protein [Xylariaceae sp. FL1272]
MFASFLGLVSLGSLALGYKVQTPPLDTPWTYKVGTDPWPEYPRPQLQRDSFQSLNGIWQWGEGQSSGGYHTGRDILVPSCMESGLSGVMTYSADSWWVREFEISRSLKHKKSDRILINFEAVDYEATVYVNDKLAGNNTGGYWRFSFDITNLLKDGKNTLRVDVFDPTEDDYNIPFGKQRNHPSHIFYTSCSGIWQSVWLESVPTEHVTQLDVAAGMDGKVNVTVNTNKGSKEAVTVTITDEHGKKVGRGSGKANQPFTFTVNSPDLWSPESPTLYNLTVTAGDDTVESYTGFRTISSGMVNGIQRPLLNDEFFFHFGTLDQGFWPDGIYTPPNYEAMVFDLKQLKDLGFNMVRKHIKVETDLFYRACDELGLLVMQDMPAMNADGSIVPTAAEQAEWERQLFIMVEQHKNYPSIYTWVIYNEGWGQIRDTYYPEGGLTAQVKSIDPTRLVDAVTGWYDHGFGDYSDNHHYANPQCGTPFYSIQSSPYDPSRIGIQGEFGGTGNNVSAEHLWKVQAAIDTINQTYELDLTVEAWNYRGHVLLTELLDQVKMYACSAAVWTQTTDVEGEVNGLLTYDRRVLRVDVDQWTSDIQALKDAAAARASKRKN